MTVAQYLARLAAEAVDHHQRRGLRPRHLRSGFRRALITIGEDMVNIAYDAPVDMPPQDQIEDAERRLFELAENGRYDGGFQASPMPSRRPSTWPASPTSATARLSGIATGMRDLDRKMGGLQPSDLIILAGRPGMGKTSLATNIAYNIAACLRGRAAGGRLDQGGERRRRRLLLARNVVGTARHPHHLRADGSPLVQDPPRRHHRGRFREAGRCSQMMQKIRSISIRPAASRSPSSPPAPAV